VIQSAKAKGLPEWATAPAVIEKNAAVEQSPGGMSTIADKLAWPALLR